MQRARPGQCRLHLHSRPGRSLRLSITANTNITCTIITTITTTTMHGLGAAATPRRQRGDHPTRLGRMGRRVGTG